MPATATDDFNSYTPMLLFRGPLSDERHASHVDALAARNRQIVASHDKGHSLREIGARFGLSHTTIAAILRDNHRNAGAVRRNAVNTAPAIAAKPKRRSMDADNYNFVRALLVDALTHDRLLPGFNAATFLDRCRDMHIVLPRHWDDLTVKGSGRAI